MMVIMMIFIFFTQGYKIDACNVYDIEPGYEEMMKRMLQECHDSAPELHFGPDKGNVMNFDLQSLVDGGEVDILKGGPPCPPFSIIVIKTGLADVRAWVMVQAIKHACFLCIV